MAIDNLQLAAMLIKAGIEPELMKEIAVFTADGQQNLVVYDEDAIDDRIRKLEEVIGENTPEHLKRGLEELKAYHYQRRKEMNI